MESWDGLLIAYEFRDLRCKNLCFYVRFFHIKLAGRNMFKTNQREGRRSSK